MNDKKYSIIELRARKGISQEELADKLKITRQTVSQWEKKVNIPNVKIAIQLAELLDVKVEEIDW